jgi:hypothetical protein
VNPKELTEWEREWLAANRVPQVYRDVAEIRARHEFEETRRFARGLGYGIALALVCWALLGIVVVAVVRAWS